MMIKALFNALVLLTFTACAATQPMQSLDVRSFGATGDGETFDTDAIQRAIDHAHKQGGGVVRFPSGGVYFTGTLVLKSNVTLHVERDAVIRGSRNLDDYIKTKPDIGSYAVIEYSDYALIQAISARNIAIEGEGVIDGDGVGIPGGYKVRPYLLRFIRCDNVRLRDITLKNPAFWTQSFLECDNIHVDGITVRAFNLDPHQPNGDGIDIDGCQNVIIENSDFAAEDDAIVLKSTTLRPMKNIIIRNNIIKTNINGIKIGTETHGVVRNVHAHDNHITFAGRAALTVQCVDGAHVSNILFEDIVIDGAGTPIFLRLGARLRPIPEQPDPQVGTLRDITFRRITSTGVQSSLPPKTTPAPHTGSSIMGIPGHVIENVVLQDIHFTHRGGIADQNATYAEVPERPDVYPNHDRFGNLAAYGLYVRHVRGITMNNVEIKFSAPDRRSAIVFYNVGDAQLTNVGVKRLDDESAPPVEFFAGSDGSKMRITRDEADPARFQLEGRVEITDD